MEETAAPVKAGKQTVSKASTKPSKALYAIFATGGKQYRVVAGDKVKIEKLGDEYKEGDKIVFDKVLLVDDGTSEATIGTPFIPGAAVNATLDKIARYKTVDVIKYKQKSRYYKKYGHRQPYFEVKIDSIK
ncbi:MAG: 50S ribosomal protein L21 [bacterium]|nr:50S ribosomal protein L21 [bacterium]